MTAVREPAGSGRRPHTELLDRGTAALDLRVVHARELVEDPAIARLGAPRQLEPPELLFRIPACLEREGDLRDAARAVGRRGAREQLERVRAIAGAIEIDPECLERGEILRIEL